jgi:hypothetical protein
MKLEFLADGSPDCPLIRLYAFDQSEILRFKDLISTLSLGTATNISLHEQPWINPVDGCTVEMRLGKRDQGIKQIGPSGFECVLTEEGWTDVAFLLEPFCAKELPRGYQWLDERGQVSLLISPSGSW